MTLRRRLVIGTCITIGVLVIGVMIATRTQHAYLVDQIDSQLEAILPATTAAVDTLLPFPPESVDASVSGLYLALVPATGEPAVLINGGLLEAPPVLLPRILDDPVGASFDTDAVDGSDSFRMMVLERSDDGVLVAALSLADVEAASEQLSDILQVMTAAVALVMLFVLFWVHRLGLRPIADLTDVADSIRGGDRSRRSRTGPAHTEAGRLGTAFNVMLDERDESEANLRRFMADAAHELRTPLTSVRGFLDLIADDRIDDDELADANTRMRRETARMQRLVEDLLLLARLDQHRPLELRPVDFAQIVSDVVADAATLHPTHALSIVDRTPRGTVVHGDEQRLTQVMIVLIDNATVHTPHGTSVVVTLDLDADQFTHIVTVSDNGPGLSEGDAKRVFERFYRADLARSRHGASGSGLGLSIASAIASSHGGRIELSTSEGSGCEFTLFIPANK